jgi:hypothetical protein
LSPDSEWLLRWSAKRDRVDATEVACWSVLSSAPRRSSLPCHPPLSVSSPSQLHPSTNSLSQLRVLALSCHSSGLYVPCPGGACSSLMWSGSLPGSSESLLSFFCCVCPCISLPQYRGRVLARLQLSCPLSFGCVRFESTCRLGFEHASALCTSQLGRFLQEARCAGSLLKVACLLAAVCSSSYHILFSPILYPSLPHYHHTMEPGLLLSKARVGGYPVPLAWGLISIHIIQVTRCFKSICANLYIHRLFDHRPNPCRDSCTEL